MAKEEYQKTIRITAKPEKKAGKMASFVEGAKQSKVKEPKSLTPHTRKVQNINPKRK
jgi:D-arabinose 5-phosphate isomerase GutQ